MGEAEDRSGEAEEARRTFVRAADTARNIGAAEALARAALGYGGRFVWVRAGSDTHLVPMLQDALVMLGGQDDGLRARLLARMACALRSEPNREPNDALSQRPSTGSGRSRPQPRAYAPGRFFAIGGGPSTSACHRAWAQGGGRRAGDERVAWSHRSRA